MVQIIMDHGASWCFGTRLAPHLRPNRKNALNRYADIPCPLIPPRLENLSAF